MTEITAERARELFDYDPFTSALTWRVSRGGQEKGTPAGSRNLFGYLITGVDGRRYYNHRLIWLWVTGAWPRGEIDHVNGDPADNRLENLRDVSSKTNRENRRRPSVSNKSGFLGVYWCAGKHRFKAQIRTGGKRTKLGMFTTPEAAHEAYLTAKRQLHAGCTI